MIRDTPHLSTVGGSGGIPPDPSLKTGRDKEKNLKKWRQRFLKIQETGTKLEQAQEEKKIAKIFLQKIRSYEEGKGKGVDLRVDNIPKLREKWDRMYKWIILLMVYIHRRNGMLGHKSHENQKDENSNSGSRKARRKKRDGEFNHHNSRVR